MHTYIERLTEVIYNLHQAVAEHVGTEEVREPKDGKPVWVGTVEVFDLTNHPTAKHCFAWEHTCGKNESELRYVAILATDQVRTSRQAVQKILAQDKLNGSRSF